MTYWKLNLGNIIFQTIWASLVHGRFLPFGLLLKSIFRFFGVPLHLCSLDSCTYIDIGSIKLIGLLPSRCASSTSAPPFPSVSAFGFILCSSDSWVICSFFAMFSMVLGHDIPEFDSLSFLSDDPLGHLVTPPDLVSLQPAIYP